MKKIKILLISFVITLILLSAILFIMMVDYSINLPNGYELVQIYGDTVLLIDNKTDYQRIIVFPDIIGYAVKNEYILGCVNKNNNEPGSTPGYFIVNMKSRNVTVGLCEQEYLKRLSRTEIDNVHRFRVPKRLCWISHQTLW